MARPALIYLNVDERSQGLCYICLWLVQTELADQSFNTVDDPSSRLCILNKAKDVTLKLFNITITGTNKSKQLINYISCNWRCRFHGRKRDSKQNQNNDSFYVGLKIQ